MNFRVCLSILSMCCATVAFSMEKEPNDVAKYCYASFAQLKADLEQKGYKNNELVQKIKNDLSFPSIEKQADLNWYPFNYFRKHGGYDGLSTLDVTLLDTSDASDETIARDYCTHSVFMTSYREMVEKVFYLLEQSSGQDTICLPAGGIPYYVPRDKDITVYDTDESLEGTLKHWPKSKAILGAEGDVYKIKGKYNIICCMGFSFYLRNIDELKALIKTFHEHLEEDGLLILNFIFSNSGLDEEGQKIANFEKALQWNMDIIFKLNQNPTFTGLFLTKEELLNACENRFDCVDIYGGSLHVHGLAVLKKR